jgi:hypothetical protein
VGTEAGAVYTPAEVMDPKSPVADASVETTFQSMTGDVMPEILAVKVCFVLGLSEAVDGETVTAGVAAAESTAADAAQSRHCNLTNVIGFTPSVGATSVIYDTGRSQQKT